MIQWGKIRILEGGKIGILGGGKIKVLSGGKTVLEGTFAPPKKNPVAAPDGHIKMFTLQPGI